MQKRTSPNMHHMKVVIAVVPAGYENRYPWKDGDHLLLLGHIENMPGHVAVVDQNGRTYWGFHEDSFRAAKADEL